MESFQRHLGAGLADRLGSDSTNRGARFNDSPIVFVADLFKEDGNVSASRPLDFVGDRPIFFVLFLDDR